MDKIKNLQNQLKEIDQEINDFQPDEADKEIEKRFHCHINELYSNNGGDTIVVCNNTFYASDLLADCAIDYVVALRDFVANMPEQEWKTLTAYKDLISKKEEIENDLQNAVAERGYF